MLKPLVENCQEELKDPRRCLGHLLVMTRVASELRLPALADESSSQAMSLLEQEGLWEDPIALLVVASRLQHLLDAERRGDVESIGARIDQLLSSPRQRRHAYMIMFLDFACDYLEFVDEIESSLKLSVFYVQLLENIGLTNGRNLQSAVLRTARLLERQGNSDSARQIYDDLFLRLLRMKDEHYHYSIYQASARNAWRSRDYDRACVDYSIALLYFTKQGHEMSTEAANLHFWTSVSCYRTRESLPKARAHYRRAQEIFLARAKSGIATDPRKEASLFRPIFTNTVNVAWWLSH
ncbi:hypothetical protein [Pseudoblastomonas halimionae]|uniref:Tetratricopeptide repeat protein n=1 Tax=Alteriqipengyuania halimionae TaxID=1926630 RepID=A0A6I4U618_9SPHN|nr:hypothetical protein [Alteriqipengyuania halimionae]MXP09892.1 hypothetical protein [Alteriqipengyuania halimionae]